jgi:redox-sensitive bicupin YhaK (pirin superfamily)
MSVRPVKQIIHPKPTLEGAGVRLQRGFGFGSTNEFDPFLLFDDFRNDNPADYLAGFPWHPHRGIETITYVLTGTVDHGDSLGNRGSLGAGDIQWMTAGAASCIRRCRRGTSRAGCTAFSSGPTSPPR